MKSKSESARLAHRRLRLHEPARPARRGAAAVAVGAFGALAAGCASVTTADGERLPLTSDRFADYAERVFREQNRIATELAFALEDADVARSPVYEALAAAEESLLEACAGLNAVAAARRDNGRIGARPQIAAARQTPDCERAAADAADVLERSAALVSGATAGPRLPGAGDSRPSRGSRR